MRGRGVGLWSLDLRSGRRRIGGFPLGRRVSLGLRCGGLMLGDACWCCLGGILGVGGFVFWMVVLAERLAGIATEIRALLGCLFRLRRIPQRDGQGSRGLRHDHDLRWFEETLAFLDLRQSCSRFRLPVVLSSFWRTPVAFFSVELLHHPRSQKDQNRRHACVEAFRY